MSDLVPLVQSALNNAPSPQRHNMAPIITFMAIREKLFNLKETQWLVSKPHPVVEIALSKNLERARLAALKGKLPNFTEGDSVLVARNQFHKGEKLSLRWWGPRRIVKAISDFIYEVEDLRNGMTKEVHASRLKFYSNVELDIEALMPFVLSSETGMPVKRLMNLREISGELKVQVRWQGLPDCDDTLEPLQQVYEDVPKILLKLLARTGTPQYLRGFPRKKR